ncbi:reverse transcriptase [Gossypium australe]|uniref:Reverse transcriptase n=1 Tax=Gossypium australe TaxID=47621 RepID=A0A5B6X3G7_9ROSI|nr:reverse transcriptase [Gossypium australe]
MSWDLLRQLNYDHDTPWVMLGDFNEIANSFEKKGGRLRSEHRMLSFRTVLEDCNLNNLRFTGRWFTWERGRFISTNIRERLDRGVATLRWMELFPSYQVKHLSHSFSDHCPVLLNTMGGKWDNQQYRTKKFQFEAKWCLESSFEEMVRKWWDPSDENLTEITKVQLGLNLEADKEELFWEQRARVNWLKNGDRNTRFFSQDC